MATTPCVSSSKLTEIIQSRIFASTPCFEPCSSKGDLNRRVQFLLDTCPANVLESIVAKYNSIQVQINEVTQKVSAWQLPKRFKKHGLFSDFLESDFNIVSQLMEKHMEIITGNHQLSTLFVDRISPTSKLLRTLMSRNRSFFPSTISTQTTKVCEKTQQTVGNLVQVLKARQVFCNISWLKFNFSPSYTKQDIKTLNSELCHVVRDGHVQKLTLSSGSFNEMQMEKKFRRYHDRLWTFFNGLSNLKVLEIKYEISDEMFRKVQQLGLRIPENLILTSCFPFDDNVAVFANVKRLSYTSERFAVGWSSLRKKMACFPNIEDLDLGGAGVLNEQGKKADWKIHKEGFRELMGGLPHVQSLTIENFLFSAILTDVAFSYQDVARYDEFNVEKISEVIVCGILMCKDFKELKLSVRGIFEYVQFTEKVVLVIQKELPRVQVRII